MATATADKQITPEQAREVSRLRRDRQLKIADLRDDLESAQESIDTISLALRDPNNKTAEGQISTELKRLHMIAASLEAAEADLAQFDSDNPSEKDLEERERLRVQAEQTALDKEHAADWKANRLAACDLVQQLLAVDAAGKELLKKSGSRGRMDGIQAAECSATIEMLHKYCNQGIEVRSALSRMRGTLEKI
jgi:hypothetical protein